MRLYHETPRFYFHSAVNRVNRFIHTSLSVCVDDKHELLTGFLIDTIACNTH